MNSKKQKDNESVISYMKEFCEDRLKDRNIDPVYREQLESDLSKLEKFMTGGKNIFHSE